MTENYSHISIFFKHISCQQHWAPAQRITAVLCCTESDVKGKCNDGKLFTTKVRVSRAGVESFILGLLTDNQHRCFYRGQIHIILFQEDFSFFKIFIYLPFKMWDPEYGSLNVHVEPKSLLRIFISLHISCFC